MNTVKRHLKLLIIIAIILVVLSIAIAFTVYFNDIACHFYGTTFQANGQLLTTLLTAIGGGAVIYGLYLNNKRIKEQTRQNDIATKQIKINADNNNDKRFGEAIGYLNSDNMGIAIGGVYALYQLAKEDKRYIPIVSNILVEELSKVSELDLTDRKYKLMFETLFTDVFNSEKITISGLKITNFSISPCRNKIFKHCEFNIVMIHNITDSLFDNVVVTGNQFFCDGELVFSDSVIDRCVITDSNANSRIQILQSTITKTQIIGAEINHLFLWFPKITDSLIIKAKRIGTLRLYNMDAQRIIVHSNKIDNLDALETVKENIKVLPFELFKDNESES